MEHFLEKSFWNSRIHTEEVSSKEKYLGHFLGSISVILINAILSNYLNVYYTDVLNISGIWGGVFIGAFPLVAKALDVLTFIYMGHVVDRANLKQGKARPWILISAPLLVISMILLFVVPVGNENVTAIWIFLSYTMFYAVAYTMYSTAHTLLVPLSTHNEEERGKLSLVANTPSMAAGSLIAILFPCLVLPMIGVDREAWLGIMLTVAVMSLPMILIEYFYTTERVTENHQRDDAKTTSQISLRKQFRGERCDGFSSSVFNCIITMASGIAMCIFNYGISALGYQAPTTAMLPVQNGSAQTFMIFCVIGVQAIAYPIIIFLLSFLKNEKYSVVRKVVSSDL